MSIIVAEKVQCRIDGGRRFAFGLRSIFPGRTAFREKCLSHFRRPTVRFWRCAAENIVEMRLLFAFRGAATTAASFILRKFRARVPIPRALLCTVKFYYGTFLQLRSGRGRAMIPINFTPLCKLEGNTPLRALISLRSRNQLELNPSRINNSKGTLANKKFWRIFPAKYAEIYIEFYEECSSS